MTLGWLSEIRSNICLVSRHWIWPEAWWLVFLAGLMVVGDGRGRPLPWNLSLLHSCVHILFLKSLKMVQREAVRTTCVSWYFVQPVLFSGKEQVAKNIDSQASASAVAKAVKTAIYWAPTLCQVLCSRFFKFNNFVEFKHPSSFTKLVTKNHQSPLCPSTPNFCSPEAAGSVLDIHYSFSPHQQYSGDYHHSSFTVIEPWSMQVPRHVQGHAARKWWGQGVSRSSCLDSGACCVL